MCNVLKLIINISEAWHSTLYPGVVVCIPLFFNLEGPSLDTSFPDKYLEIVSVKCNK